MCDAQVHSHFGNLSQYLANCLPHTCINLVGLYGMLHSGCDFLTSERVYKTTTLYGYTAWRVWWNTVNTPNVSIYPAQAVSRKYQAKHLA